MKVLAGTTAPEVVAETTAQVLVSDTITLPVAAIKVSEIVASVRDLNCFVINNKVIFQGTLHKQVFFVDHKGLVRHVGVDVPFSGFVDVPGVQAGASCELFPSIEFLNFTFIPPNMVQETAVIAIRVKITNMQAGGVLFTNTLPPTLLRFEEPNTFRVSGNPPGSVAIKEGTTSLGNVAQAGNIVCPVNTVQAENVVCPGGVTFSGGAAFTEGAVSSEKVAPAGNVVCPFVVSPANTGANGNVICTGNTVTNGNAASSGKFVTQGNGHSTTNGGATGMSSTKET